MSGFEPWISVVRSDRSTNCTTTYVQAKVFWITISTFVSRHYSVIKVCIVSILCSLLLSLFEYSKLCCQDNYILGSFRQKSACGCSRQLRCRRNRKFYNFLHRS